MTDKNVNDNDIFSQLEQLVKEEANEETKESVSKTNQVKKEKLAKEEKEKKEKQPKKNKQSPEESSQADLVLNYIKKENWPYGLINILENLKKAVKKPDLIKILDQLTESGDIKNKIFGKFPIFFANQVRIEFDESKLEKLKEQLVQLKEEQQEIQEELKEKQDQLKREESNISTEQLWINVSNQQKLLKELTEKLAMLQKMDNKIIDPQEMKNKEDKLKMIKIKSKKYKQVCKDMFGQLQEATEMSKKELYQQLNLEESIKF